MLSSSYYLIFAKEKKQQIIMQANTPNYNSQKAMQQGTILGLYWIATAAIYILGLSNAMLSVLFLILITFSPFFAAILVAKYRKQECDNKMTFLTAWSFLIIMYVCASLLFAVAQYIYFMFIDKGFFITFLQEQISLLQQVSELDSMTIDSLKQVGELWGQMTTSDIVLQFLSSNMMIAGIITPITAIFVKRTPKNSR